MCTTLVVRTETSAHVAVGVIAHCCTHGPLPSSNLCEGAAAARRIEVVCTDPGGGATAPGCRCRSNKGLVDPASSLRAQQFSRRLRSQAARARTHISPVRDRTRIVTKQLVILAIVSALRQDEAVWGVLARRFGWELMRRSMRSLTREWTDTATPRGTARWKGSESLEAHHVG